MAVSTNWWVPFDDGLVVRALPFGVQNIGAPAFWKLPCMEVARTLVLATWSELGEDQTIRVSLSPQTCTPLLANPETRCPHRVRTVAVFHALSIP